MRDLAIAEATYRAVVWDQTLSDLDARAEKNAARWDAIQQRELIQDLRFWLLHKQLDREPSPLLKDLYNLGPARRYQQRLR